MSSKLQLRLRRAVYFCKHISLEAMGSSMVDVNNSGWIQSWVNGEQQLILAEELHRSTAKV